jgi:3-oxoacyl-[acyl-carrier-protein] synthase II
MRRVAITGAGTINALGVGVEAFADGLRASRCAIGTLSLFDTAGYRTSCAAEVRALSTPAWLPTALARHVSRSDLFALIAAREALLAARLYSQDTDDPRPSGAARQMGVVIGATTGGMHGSEEYYRRSLTGARRQRHATLLTLPVSSSGDVIANLFGCDGPRLAVSTACSSGGNALGIAADWIRAGRVDAVLCGGTDSLCRMTFSGFNALQALDSVPCRPFDRERAGLSLGEGAAMFVMEDRDRALARGATVLAEFVGYGVSADAHHIAQPRPDGAGALLAMQRALQESGVEPEEIDYVNAHGTATPLNDVLETRALKALLGARAYRVPVSSTKSMVGHCLGAAGAIEALACVLALRGGFVPATANLQHPDPECDLDYVPRAMRSQSLRTVLSNSYGFGGNNTSIVLRAAEAVPAPEA